MLMPPHLSVPPGPRSVQSVPSCTTPGSPKLNVHPIG